MTAFNKKAVKQNRPQPHQIIDIAERMEECDEPENRVVAMPGKGKSQATVYIAKANPKPDVISAYQHTTVMDKFKDWHDAKKDGIVPQSRKAEFICSWQKYLGIKDHDGTIQSVEYLDKEEVPDKASTLWDSNPSDRKKLIRKTVKDGGKEARLEYSDNPFVENFKIQFNGYPGQKVEDLYKNKIIFCTMDMAKQIGFIINQFDSGDCRIFLDEGIAGRLEEKEIRDVSKLFDSIDKSNKNGNSTQHQAKKIQLITNPDEDKRSNYNRKGIQSEVQELIDIACKVQEHIERDVNVDKEIVPPFMPEDDEDIIEIENGIYQMTDTLYQRLRNSYIANSSFFSGEAHYIQLQENKAYRSELITIKRLLEWLWKVEKRGIVFQKIGSDIKNMSVSRHHLKNLRHFPCDQFFLLRATYPKDWDEAMDNVLGFDPNILCEDISLRNADLSEWDARFWKIEPGNSLNKNRRDGKWCEYLHKVLDESDWLKTSVSKIGNRFDGDFYYYEEVMGMNLDHYDNHYLASIPRLRNSDLYYNALKEFKQFPDHPQDEDTRDTKNGNLVGWTDPLLQAIQQNDVDSKFVDALLRTARSEDQMSDIFAHATTHILQDWIGTMEWDGEFHSWKEFLNRVVISERLFEEAIQISNDFSDAIDLGDRDWTVNRGSNMRVNMAWSIRQMLHKDLIEIEEVHNLCGRSRDSIRKKMKRLKEVDYIGNGLAEPS